MKPFEFSHPQSDGGNRFSATSGYVDQEGRNSEVKGNMILEKKQRLLEDFGKEEGFQDQDLLSREQVRSILNKKLRNEGKVFDDELIDAIFSDKSSINRDIEGRISKRDLCDAYIEIENYFCDNIGKCNYKILELIEGVLY